MPGMINCVNNTGGSLIIYRFAVGSRESLPEIHVLSIFDSIRLKGNVKPAFEVSCGINGVYFKVIFIESLVPVF